MPPSAPRIAFAAPLVRSETTHPNLAHALEQATVAAAYHHQARENVKKTAVTTASGLSRLVSLAFDALAAALLSRMLTLARALPWRWGRRFATSLATPISPDKDG